MISFAKTFQERARSIIEGRDEGRWPLTGRMLTGLSALYGMAVRSRILLHQSGWLKSRRLPGIVISVGNVTAGGTGKTPMTMYVAHHLHKAGYRVAILSRGYGGRAEHKGGVVSDGRQILMGPDEAGDEPHMMASSLPGLPVLVGRDRYRSGMRALRDYKAHILVLDDGFQHLKLHRDINLLLLDSRRPFGNGHLLPRGPLRLPPSSAAWATAVVFTRCREQDPPPGLPAGILGTSNVFGSRHLPTLDKVVHAGLSLNARCSVQLEQIDPATIYGAPVFGFSGIANNADFERSLQDLGFRVNGFCGFSDHYRYSDADLRMLREKCALGRGEWLATTEKDFHRVCHRLPAGMDMIVVGTRVTFLSQSGDFNRYIENACRSLATATSSR